MNLSNNYIGSNTRLFLSQNVGLSGADLDKVENVLSYIRPTSPSGLIFDLCCRCGAIEDNAIKAGVAVELFYSACSLTDDIQDGESGYAGKNLAEQINLQAILICSAFNALNRLNAVDLYSVNGIRMLIGQSVELDKVNGIDTYSYFSERIAGEAFNSYFSLIPICVDKTLEGYKGKYDWSNYGKLLGILIQICTDQESLDLRWISIDKKHRSMYTNKVLVDFERLAGEMPVEVRYVSDINIKRIKCVISVLDSGENM